MGGGGSAGRGGERVEPYGGAGTSGAVLGTVPNHSWLAVCGGGVADAAGGPDRSSLDMVWRGGRERGWRPGAETQLETRALSTLPKALVVDGKGGIDDHPIRVSST